MFVSTAYAQTAAPAAGGTDMLVQFMPLILIFVVFYVLLIRPQQKKAKEHRSMLEAIRRGDRVVTGGGILGTVTKVGPDEELQVEIAENVRVRCLRSTVSAVLTKTEPVGKNGGTGGDTAPAPEGETKAAAPTSGLAKMFGRK